MRATLNGVASRKFLEASSNGLGDNGTSLALGRHISSLHLEGLAARGISVKGGIIRVVACIDGLLELVGQGILAGTP